MLQLLDPNSCPWEGKFWYTSNLFFRDPADVLIDWGYPNLNHYSSEQYSYNFLQTIGVKKTAEDNLYTPAFRRWLKYGRTFYVRPKSNPI